MQTDKRAKETRMRALRARLTTHGILLQICDRNFQFVLSVLVRCGMITRY